MLKRKRPFWLNVLYGCVFLAICYMAYNAYAIRSYMSGIKETPLNQWQGAENGEKIIVEFVDYRCSYCRKAHPAVKQVIERNPDVKVVYRHYPVFGRQSIHEAQVALAAGLQGEFAQAHELLISRDAPLQQDEIEGIARDLGLDVEKFMTDLKGPEIGNFFLYTLDAAERLGINSTPTFVVDDIIFRPTVEYPTPEMFEDVLEEAYGS